MVHHHLSQQAAAYRKLLGQVLKTWVPPLFQAAERTVERGRGGGTSPGCTAWQT